MPQLFCRRHEIEGPTMVEPETFTYLANLKLNNRKAWADEHREERDDAMRNFTGIAITLHDYSDRYDTFVAESRSKPKQSYTKFFQEPRDRVGPGLYRTSVDVFANAGQPTENFGYYLHIEPGNCHAGAALFQPSKSALARLQVLLVSDPEGLRDVLTDPEFMTTFPDGIVTRNALAVVPDVFSGRDPAAAYLKMSGLGCRKDLQDEDLLDDELIDQLIEIFRTASALVRYFE
jgi:uncharacterized protein (TIGR02453 family)|tara:strand:- start:211 stop:909 length:699 start_codon:yes stop_codon:yes gene_type:complete